MRQILFKLIVPLLLGLGTIFSFFREVIIAYYYGTSRDLEIFRVAFAIPYALFQSLGTVLVGALLPIIIHEGKDLIFEIKRQVRKLFIIFAVFAALTANWQAKILAPGFTYSELETLKINLVICWIILIISALIFPIRLLLQEQNKKMLVSSTSLIYSLFFILFIFIFNGFSPKFDLSIVSVASAMMVFVIYSIFSKLNIVKVPVNTTKSSTNKKIQKIILGSFIYVLFLAIPRLIDKAAASKMNIGVIANLEYAMNFYVAFGVLIGTSFTIIFARKIALEYRNSANIAWLLKIIGVPFLLASFVSILILPFSEELVRIAYLRGAFTQSNVTQVTEILYWFLITLPLMVSGMILLQIIAAYSIFILIGLAIFKSIMKLSWILLFFNEENLSIFGTSTLVMELMSVIAMFYFLHFYTSTLKIKKLSK